MNYSLLCQFINYVSSYDDNYTQAMKRVQAHQQYSQFENYASSSSSNVLLGASAVIILLFLLLAIYLVMRDSKVFSGSYLTNQLRPYFPDVCRNYDTVSFQIYGMGTTINFFGDEQDENSCTCLTIDFLNKGIEANIYKNLSVSGNDRRRFYKIFHVIIEEGGLFDFEKCTDLNSLKQHLRISSDDPLLKKKLYSDVRFLKCMMELYSAVNGDGIECALERDCLRIRCPYILRNSVSVKKLSLAAVKLLNVSLDLVKEAGIKLAISASSKELLDKYSEHMSRKLLRALASDMSEENFSAFSKSNIEWNSDEDIFKWAYDGSDGSKAANGRDAGSGGSSRRSGSDRNNRDVRDAGDAESGRSDGFGGGFDENFNVNSDEKYNENPAENPSANENASAGSNENPAESAHETVGESGNGTRTHIPTDGDEEF